MTPGFSFVEIWENALLRYYCATGREIRKHEWDGDHERNDDGTGGSHTNLGSFRRCNVV
jgi:hypothetical protein